MKRILVVLMFAIGMALGCSNASAQVVLTPPIIDPVSGTYIGSQTILIGSGDLGATICYAVNGTPSSSPAGTCAFGSTTYSGTFTITASQSISAIATKSGDTDSAVTTNNYIITANPTNSAYTNFCTSGGANSTTSGLNSSNLLLSAYTYCTITVYATGTTTKIPIFSNSTGTVLSNPFFASAVTGQFLFYGATGTVVDVTMSAGYPAPGIVSPVTLTGITLGGGGGGGGGGIGYPPAGVPHSSGSSWLSSFGIQGSDINVMTAGTVTGTGAALCTDANGGATTVGCLSGTLGGSVSPFFTPYSNATNQLVNSPDFWDATGAATHTFVSTTKEVHQTPETDYVGASGVAGSFSFLQGTAPSVITNNVTLAAPTSVTGYNLFFPSTQGQGCWLNDGSGNSTWSSTCGATNFQPIVVPPISGQYVIIYPTVAVGSGVVGCTNGQAGAGLNQVPSGLIKAVDCSVGGRSASAIFTGASLPSYVNPANVTAVYAFAYTSYTQAGNVLSNVISTGLTSPYTSTTMLSTDTSYSSSQTTTLTTFAGTDIPSAGISFSGTGSTCGSPSCGSGFVQNSQISIYSTGFIVYYTGSAPPPINILQIGPCLSLLNNVLGTDPTCPGPANSLFPMTVAQAITASYPLPVGTAFLVDDGLTTIDCGTGGGTLNANNHLCYSTNSSGALSAIAAGSNVTVNGGSALGIANFNGTTPAAGTNGLNVTFQNSGANVSAEIVGDGTATHFLNGIGTYTTPASSCTNCLITLPPGSNAAGTLQTAITAAAAGSTLILPASYAETPTSGITIAKALTLECQPGATLTKGANVNLISITASNVVIKGCTFNGGGFTGDTILATSVSKIQILGNTILNGNGVGVFFSGVTASRVQNNSVQSNNADDIVVFDASNNDVISGNFIDNSQDLVFSKGISIHSNSVPSVISNITVSNNTITNRFGFAIEVGPFNGYMPTSINISGNVATQLSSTHAGSGTSGDFGGYSIFADTSTTTGNSYTNESGQMAGLPGLEIFGQTHDASNNTITGAVATVYTTSSSFSGNNIMQGNLVATNGNNTGNPVIQQLSITGNVVNTSGVIPGNAWTASTALEQNYIIKDTNGCLEKSVFRLSVSSNLTGATQPTWPACTQSAAGTITHDNNIDWMDLGPPMLPQLAAGTAYPGIELLCNTSGLTCGQYLVQGNTIIDNLVSTDQGFQDFAISGTTQKSTVFEGNQFVGWSTCYSVGSGLSPVLWMNDETGCGATGGIASAAHTALPITTPSLVGGSGCTITGTWPNQTVSCTGSGGDTITSPGSTITVGGTSTNTTLDIALGHANTWTSLQTFGTNISIGGVTAGGATGTGNVVFSASPALTGTPTAPTQSCASNTDIATGAYVAACAASGGIANITIAVTGATQTANSCTSPATATQTGVTTSSHVTAAYSADPTSLTGWGSSGGMVFDVWPSASNTVSWIACNQTTSSITFSSITFSIGAQ